MRTLQFNISTSMIQNMMIDSIYADSIESRKIAPEEREEIDLFLLELNNFCIPENNYTVTLSVSY